MKIGLTLRKNVVTTLHEKNTTDEKHFTDIAVRTFLDDINFYLMIPNEFCLGVDARRR
jgi:hypothetical protein